MAQDKLTAETTGNFRIHKEYDLKEGISTSCP